MDRTIDKVGRHHITNLKNLSVKTYKVVEHHKLSSRNEINQGQEKFQRDRYF